MPVVNVALFAIFATDVRPVKLTSDQLDHAGQGEFIDR